MADRKWPLWARVLFAVLLVPVWAAGILAAENDFTVDYITGTERIDDESLAQYQLFIQLNYPPYRWAPIAKKAFEDYIAQGRGGWIGFHHDAPGDDVQSSGEAQQRGARLARVLATGEASGGRDEPSRLTPPGR